MIWSLIDKYIWINEIWILAIVKTHKRIASTLFLNYHLAWEDNILPGKGFGQYNIKKLERNMRDVAE